MIKVDILLPCYNEEKTIVECIKRIRKVTNKQKYDYSIIVSDNEDYYSIKPLIPLVVSDEDTEMPLMTFEIKSEEEKEINVENNIKTFVSIHDEYGDGKEETEISFTVKQATPPDDPIDENSKTGNTITTILFMLLSLLLGTGIFIVVYRYKSIEL